MLLSSLLCGVGDLLDLTRSGGEEVTLDVSLLREELLVHVGEHLEVTRDDVSGLLGVGRGRCLLWLWRGVRLTRGL